MIIISFFDNHTHTHYSNIRLLDSTNKAENLIEYALELNLAGIAITEHECLSGAVKLNQLAKKLHETNPDFTIAIGNEIYLVDSREKGQKYYHFILLAKDRIGFNQLQELSTIAWMHSFYDRGMERVPLLKEELEEIVSANPGHLIATSACIGGELGSNILMLDKCEKVHDSANASIYANNISNFIQYCKKVFNDDFYIEVAPACSKEQIIVNKRLASIAKCFNVNLSLGSDAHYLKKDLRFVHKSFLNSKGGDREVDSFYEYTYLQSENEARQNLSASFDNDFIDQIFNSTLTIKNKIEFYDLFHKQDVVEIPVRDYPKSAWWKMSKEYSSLMESYPTLQSMFISDNIQERYWMNQCWESLQNKIGIWYEHLNYVARLEEEAHTKRVISEKLETNMFCYPNTLQHYIDFIWDCDSIVGAGRGSSCAGLNHWLLNITQMDPIRWNFPWFRYLNEERVELGDIDLDLCPSRRPAIISAIKEERQKFLHPDLKEYMKKELGITLIATFGTETTKSAIQTACRGYYSEKYPNGIDVDEAQYLSSLIPQTRGFLWPIHDVLYGNEESDRKPIQSFIAAARQYPGLIDIIQSIEGLISKRSSHASGVVMFNNNPFESCAFMRTPKGEIITQYDLHDAEYMGNVKYDFLVTEVSDKIAECIRLLQEDGEIDAMLSLREAYNQYLHPETINMNNPQLWQALHKGEVLNVFQFDSVEGVKAVNKIKPTNIQELTDANGLLRLMTAEKGAEMPIDKYVRYRNNINLWYNEMQEAGLTEQEQKTLEPYFKQSYGVPPSQEQLMLMLMDENICHFTLAEANNARKIVGKKKLDKIPGLREKVIKQASSAALGEYVWTYGAGPQMGYSFSMIHSLAYSAIGVQTLYLATHWNPIYWDTACLIVNSGSLQDNSEEEIVDIYAPEQEDLQNGVTFIDLPDRSGKIRKTSSTDYCKIAKAIGDIRKANIQISLLDINKSDFGFKPDVKNNCIIYGLKSVSNIGDDLIKKIITMRPYDSLIDFYTKVNPNRTAMINLIKGGAFDHFESRQRAMVEFLWLTCNKKQRLTLQNMSGLIKYDIIPHTPTNDEAISVFEFNRYLKAECKYDSQSYRLDLRALEFLIKINQEQLINNERLLNIKEWTKVYNNYMDIIRNWIAENKEEALDKLNTAIFMESWEHDAQGNVSSWEMSALCFYYHEHELAHINNAQYGFVNFFYLNPVSEVSRVIKRGDNNIPIYKLSRICGTCIAKNKLKSIVYLLTVYGVVSVKFTKEYFSMYDRQISEKQPDGTKKVVEKSWFNRGNMLVIQGYRREEEFVAKNYAAAAGHQLYHIDQINADGTLDLRHERKGEVE